MSFYQVFDASQRHWYLNVFSLMVILRSETVSVMTWLNRSLERILKYSRIVACISQSLVQSHNKSTLIMETYVSIKITTKKPSGKLRICHANTWKHQCLQRHCLICLYCIDRKRSVESSYLIVEVIKHSYPKKVWDKLG